MIGSKLLRNRINKIDGLIKVFDRTRYLIMFGVKKYQFIAGLAIL